MPDPTTLSEKNRAKLDGIVQQMISNKESEDNINFVVNDFKNKYTEKKNSVSSTSKETKSELAPKTGSSVGKNTQGFPEIDSNGIAPDYKKMKTDVGPTSREAVLRNKLATTKVTSDNMEQVSTATDELSVLQKAKHKTQYQNDEKLIQRLNTTDDNRTATDLADEKDDNQVTDYLREGAKNVGNVIGGIVNIFPKAINALSGKNLAIPTIDKFEKKIPLEKQLKQVQKEDTENKLTPEEKQQRAEELFRDDSKKEQVKENFNNALTPGVLGVFADNFAEKKALQERLKAHEINKISNLTSDQKANSAQIQLYGGQGLALKKDIESDLAVVKSGKADANFIQNLSDKQGKYKEVEDKYLSLLDEQTKIKNTKLSVEENIDHFKLDYDPIAKVMDDTVGAFETPIGGALNLMGKTADALRNIPGAKSLDVNDGEKSTLSVLGEKLIVDAENRSKSHRAIELDNIHSASDFGSYVTQVFTTASPYLLGGIEYQAGKSILGSAAGTGFFMAGSGGKKAYDMDQEIKADPSIDYNNLQYLSAIAGYMGAEKLMLGGYDKIIKGAGATIESIGKNPVERELFDQGIKTYFTKAIEGTGKFISATNKSGMIGLTTGLTRMATDNISLGKKSENPFKEMIDGYVNMAAMHLVMSGPPELVKTGSYALSKVSEGKSKKQVAENYEKIKRLTEQLQKPDLTDNDKNILNTAVSLLHQDNQKTIGKSLEKLGTFTRSQVKELLTVDQEKLAVRKQVEALNGVDSGISADAKPELLKVLKTQFEAIEDRKMDVFNNENNSLNLLPASEQKRLMADAKEELYNTSKTDKEGNEVEITDKDIKDKATAIHLEQERFNGMDIKAIEVLKKIALRQLKLELTDEQKQKGISISNYEITKRAIENHNKTIVSEIETATTTEAQPQGEQTQTPGIEEKNGTFYITDKNGVTKSFATKEEAQTKLAEAQAEVQKPSEAEKVDGNYIFEGKEYIIKDGSISDIDGNLLPLDFSSEESTYRKIISKGEKVENQEVSPLEDVVAPSIEQAEGVSKVVDEPIIYKVTALLPKKFNAESNNTLMTESELELLDAKAEKIINNPKEDVSDRIRIQQGNAFTIQDLDAIEQFFKARREGIETRSFSDWRKNTTLENNEATPTSNTPTDGNVRPSVEPNAPQGKNDNVPEAVDAKPSEGEAKVNAKEQDEFDNLLSGEAEKRRKDGKYSRDGVEFVRQEKSSGPVGKKDVVKFADKEEVAFEYQLMEAKEVQPSHLNGKRNPDFFITEAQPKNRKDDASKKASDEIGKNPKLKEAGENSNAYSGAPVVNERGEVIQGNNRAEGLKKHYSNNGKDYKEQLKADAEKYGFTPEQIDGMGNPILVRKVAVTDAKAIELGNRDVKDLETGGTRRLDPVSTSRRIPKTVKAKIIDALFRDNSDVTLNKAVRENQGALLGLLKDYMNEAQMESIVRKDGTMRPNGVEDLEKLVQHFLFDGGNVNMPEHFESLSGMAREGVLKSLPKLLSIESAKSIIPELQNAIGAFHAFKQSGVEDFKAWLNQVDMFDEGRTPAEKYSPLEIEIADILHNSKNQKEIKTIFDEYSKEVNDFAGDMFEPAKKGLSKKEAVEKVFKITDYEDKRNDPESGNKVITTPEGTPNGKGPNGSGTDIPNGSAPEKLGGSNEGNRRIEEISNRLGARIKEAEMELTRPLSTHELEDLEKRVVLDYAKENNLWIDDFYSLGSRELKGGNEHTLVVDEKNDIVFKSNNLFNSKNSIAKLFDTILIHNKLFPETKYEIVGFTGLDNGEKRTPYVEVVLKQDYIRDATQATPEEIATYMKSMGFEKVSETSFTNGKYTISDLFPRNVLKTEKGGIAVIDNMVSENKETLGKKNNGGVEGENKPTPEAKKYSVRDLAEMPNGEVSAAVFSSLEKGDTFKVGNKTYEVTTKTKDRDKSYVSKKDGKTVNYKESKIITKEVLKDGYGKAITSTLWTRENGNSSWHGIDSNRLHEQLSRDIEGDVNVDMLNENNKFHNKSDSYNLAQKHLDKVNSENDNKGVGEVSNEQNRNSKLAKERVQYEKITPKNAPKKLSQIIKDVANGLKSHLIYSRSKRINTLGSYNPRNTLVRITKAGDIDTVAHELGHLLDDRLNILGTIPAVDKAKIDYQLKWYSDRGGSNPPTKYNAAQKAEYLQREGLAEFIRSYIANPSQAKVLAPELLVHFEKTIDPKTQTVLTKFSEDYLDIANASGIEKTLSNIEEIDLPNKNKFIEWIKGFRNSEDKLTFTTMDKFYGEMANSNHFAIKAFKVLVDIQGKANIKAHENFEIISRVFLGINGKLENVFSTGMINAKNEKLRAEGGVFTKDSKGRTVYKDGTAMNVKWLIDGLDTTTEVSLKKDMSEVIAMAVAERTIEYAKKFQRSDDLTGIGGSLETDLTTAVNTLNEFKNLEKSDKAKFDRIQEGVKRYRQMADAALQYAADKGRISKEQLEQIKQGNEYYVALNRNRELEPGEDLFSSFNTGTNGIGAAKEIIKKSKGGTDTIENPYLSLLKNMNNIIKEADRNEVMLSFVEPLISTRNMGEGEPINLSKIGFIANDKDTETIKVFRDGKLEKWKFDKDIYSSLKNIESIASNPIFTFLSKPSQLIRWTVTHNPVFYARNIVKDTQARMIVSNDHSSFKDIIHNSGDKELFELFGGSQAGHLHTSKESYAKTMQGTIKEITKKGGIVINPLRWGEKYVKFLQTGENLNRIAEFNNSYKVGKEKGMSDYDAGLYAAFQARDLMDFAVAGHTMREINKIVVFSNAGVQSLRKASKSFKNDPAGFAYRTALYSVLPTVAFSVLRNAMGDDDEYEDLPDNQRDMFFNFKTPATGDAWVSVPKPYELGLFSAYVDRSISKIRGNDKAFDGVTGTTMKLLLPFDESSFLGGLKPLIETKMNRDTYTDRSIVPEWESGKLLELRKGTDKASLVGQKMSKLFKEAGMSVDPRNIDHILKGYGTYFATQGMAVSDLAKKDREQVNFWITKTGFAKDIPTYNAKSVKKATDLAVELGKINSGRMKGMRNDIEAFYLETDINKRKELLNTIYKKSKDITDYYEKEKVKTLDKISKEEE